MNIEYSIQKDTDITKCNNIKLKRFFKIFHQFVGHITKVKSCDLKFGDTV